MPPPERALGAARLVWGVAALFQAVADALAARFAACTVRGEISGFTRAASGHCYFTLKDADGARRCCAARCSAVPACCSTSRPRDGQLVELRGRLARLRAARRTAVHRRGDAARRRRARSTNSSCACKARLEAEGLFDAARKRRLPVFPRAIGVVTSLGAAALHDVLSALARRAPHLPVVIYPSPRAGRRGAGRAGARRSQRRIAAPRSTS